MRTAESGDDAAAVWDIATPPWPARLQGVGMAGFRARTTDPVDLGVVPYPAVTVAVDLSGGLLAVGDTSGRQCNGSVVVGLEPTGVRGRGRDIECLQVRLSPVVAHAVLGACSELDGTVVPLDDLWGRDAARFQERLRAAESWDERFAIAEAALARRQEAGRAVDPEVAFVWEHMVTNLGGVRVERLAAEVGWSRKRLWSRFRSQIGLNPKRAAQLVRFDQAVHRLAAGHSAARVAAEIGYVDQSHLHRDVRAFAGVTPKAVSRAPWLAVDDVAWAAPAYLSGPCAQDAGRSR
ncbi:AraC-like DNA-binding protein [Streptomyces griseochromogenes]|uniref:AraC family transcriptional regulator n=1 Tax=Streptomyces griseochromogenes TaxID=68214 RepID=A0A1B1B081_9ACTN|nr:AraC family transcriptional regulator [Streptomyces griseochromogenes]ANP52217.1 AraC family transcriptional regulator [Streptomyces griseochromogenes]MBP2055691.1 AraC-like DNA-binding protein [Streptomyces griseochromogenes]